MTRILRRPLVNAVCIGIFSMFYTVVFVVTATSASFSSILSYAGAEEASSAFWMGWSRFLAAGHHQYIAYVLLAATAVVVCLLFLRRKPYDEYHTAILLLSLVVALVLTLVAIAVFYLTMLADPTGMIEKFTLFITLHWATVVACDIAFVLLCGQR